ncbi:hypothetical protein EVAR_51044_1 [Eumeta japonica]|uniref:Uncharacterized protein n=1 Tax=Eumeta variegata TaxID=151549 RepID=A0A4C1Y8L2_EUMVA|nr:hypothetical protein EVAR_51044_1 [Eumeta japonica]
MTYVRKLPDMEEDGRKWALSLSGRIFRIQQFQPGRVPTKRIERTRTEVENETGVKTEWRIGTRIKSVTETEIKDGTGTRIERENQIGIGSKVFAYI